MHVIVEKYLPVLIARAGPGDPHRWTIIQLPKLINTVQGRKLSVMLE